MMLAPFWADSPTVPSESTSLLDTRHLALTKNSLVLAAGTTCLCLVIGTALALIMHRTDLWGRGIFRNIYVIPMLIPPYVHAIVWTHLESFAKQFLHIDIHSLWGVVIVLTLAYFPFVTLTTLSGLKSIDRNLEEASLLCHGRWKTMRGITLPLLTPHIFSGATFVFIFSIIDFGVPDILRVRVYPLEIFIQFSAFFDERAATLLSLPLVGITVLLLVLQKRLMKDRSYVQISAGISNEKESALGWLRGPALGFCLLVFGLSVALPLVVLGTVVGPFSNFSRALTSSLGQIGYSFMLAFSGATFALLLAVCLSYLMKRSRMRMRPLLEFSSYIPLSIPAITLGIGLIKVWNRPVADIVYGSSLIIVLGYVAHFIPFSVITVSSGFKQINPRLEEVAHLNVQHWTRVTWKIVLPLLRPSLITGFFIVFILSLGELGMTLLIIPPGRETIPIKIYNLMHYGAEQMVAALCLLLVAIVLAFSGLFLIFHRKLTKRISA